MKQKRSDSLCTMSLHNGMFTNIQRIKVRQIFSGAMDQSIDRNERGEVAPVRIRRTSCSFGRVACIASCQFQNWATGYCGDDDVCRCSRCDDGRGNYPSVEK